MTRKLLNKIKLLRIKKSVEEYKGHSFEKVSERVNEIHKVIWFIVPFIWIVILIITAILYKYILILKLIYGVLGAALLALGTPLSAQSIMKNSAGYLGYSPPIITSLLYNILKITSGLFLVILSLVL